MITVSTMDARRRLGDLLDRVALRGDEYLIQREGKPLAVILPVAKAAKISKVARLLLGKWLIRPNAVRTDREAMALANEARGSLRTAERDR